MLNEVDIDWEPKDTKYLNKRVINDMKKYNNILNKRANNILNDLQIEGINNIESNEDQKEIVKALTKGLWR